MIELLLWIILALFGGMVLISIWINIELGKPHIIEKRQYRSEYWSDKKKKDKIINLNHVEVVVRSKQ